MQHGTLVAVADVGGAGTGTPPTGLGEALLLCGLRHCRLAVHCAQSGCILPLQPRVQTAIEKNKEPEALLL